ncbi:DNA polymerase III subunit epsilon, partial [Acinetobacter baumannii]
MIPYILGVDTETTGLEVENGDKIIEIALIKYDLDGAKLEEFVQRIDPERNIDPKAQ